MNEEANDKLDKLIDFNNYFKKYINKQLETDNVRFEFISNILCLIHNENLSILYKLSEKEHCEDYYNMFQTQVDNYNNAINKINEKLKKG